MGKISTASPRSTVIEFLLTNDKDYMTDAHKELAGTQISLSSQFPPEMSEKRLSLKKQISSLSGDKILQQDRLIIDGEQYVLQQQNPALTLKPYRTDKVNWKQLIPKVKISSAVHDKGNTFVGCSAPILNCKDTQIILDASCA